MFPRNNSIDFHEICESSQICKEVARTGYKNWILHRVLEKDVSSQCIFITIKLARICQVSSCLDQHYRGGEEKVSQQLWQWLYIACSAGVFLVRRVLEKFVRVLSRQLRLLKPHDGWLRWPKSHSGPLTIFPILGHDGILNCEPCVNSKMSPIL